MTELQRQARRRLYKRDQSRRYYSRHRAQRIAASRAYQMAHPEKVRDTKRRWTYRDPANLESMRRSRRKWQRSHPVNNRKNSLNHYHKKRAGSRALSLLAAAQKINELTR